MRFSGFVKLVEAVTTLVSMMAHHWYTAFPLLFWPELLALTMVLTAHSSNARHLRGWTMWLFVVAVAQVLGVSLAVTKGWAGGDDASSIVLAAFFGSLPGALAGMWFFQLVVDTQDARNRAPDRVG